jgi:hypothetical protein
MDPLRGLLQLEQHKLVVIDVLARLVVRTAPILNRIGGHRLTASGALLDDRQFGLVVVLNFLVDTVNNLLYGAGELTFNDQGGGICGD